MFTKYVNTLFYLFAIFALLSTTGCAAVQPAMPEAQAAPQIAMGQLLSLQNACTYYWANEVMRNVIPNEPLISPSGNQIIIQWVIPGWAHLRGVLLVNIKETSAAYWQNLQGMVGNGEDVQALVDKAKDMGWTSTTVKDLGLTSFAGHVAKVMASIGTLGETLMFGVTLTTDDLWQSIVFADMEDY